ncbi:hypothetical protein EBT16_03580 [bacterium]|nr:hypothetical protein [bacterium]
MIRHRFNYWSCSRLADWIRGVKKPMVLGMDEWDAWRDEAKSRSPFRFWIAEKFLNSVQNFFMFPIDLWHSISAYFRNRFVTKTHFLKTGLEPGAYHELDDRILHGLFNELKDFVEVELAWMHGYGNKDYRFRGGRCREAGLGHLEWASGLKYDELVGKDDPKFGKPTPQAESAVIIRELYKWWTETRPSRPEPMDASGWTEDYKKKNGDRKDSFKKLRKIERDYEKEDERMLLKLIKIRKHLWT